MGSAEELPFLREFVLCHEFHWTWADLMATPNSVVELFTLYLNARAVASKFDNN